MGILKTIQSKEIGVVKMEHYLNTFQMMQDLEIRKETSPNFKGDPYKDPDFTGIKSKQEAMDKLRYGDAGMKDNLQRVKLKPVCINPTVTFSASPIGFAPIVPNAILGLPQSMVASTLDVKDNKIIDMVYDITASCGTSTESMLKAGTKVLEAILSLEAQGYRINLYAMQGYYQDKDTDMLLLQVKQSYQRMNLQRMAFPLIHPGFFRGVGFDWYSKTPQGKYKSGYGQGLCYAYSEEVIQTAMRQIINPKVYYLSCIKIMNDGVEAITKRLTNNKAK